MLFSYTIVTGYSPKFTVLLMKFCKIASYKASHKRYKAYFVIIACINLIGWAVINFAGSENILQHN